MSDEADVIVLGAGVIGVCSAYYLAKSGLRTIVIDQNGVCSGASYGNAGLLTPSHAIPLPAPGVLTNGIKWLLDSRSPFYIKPRFSMDLVRWLVRFLRASTPQCVERAMPAMHQLSRISMDLFEEIVASEQLECNFHHQGWTQVFVTERGLNDYREEARTLAKIGIESWDWNGAETRKHEHALSKNVIGGIHFPGDGHLNPGAFVMELARCVEALGSRIITHEKVETLDCNFNNHCVVKTNQAQYSAQYLVVASGFESVRFARPLGVRIPIEPAKGYAIIVNRTEAGPEAPMLLGDARIGVNAMGDSLRFAGTLELAGNDMRISQRRIDAMLARIPEYLPGIELSNPVEIWCGMRPCTPDGLPMIGRCPDHPNVIVATGHGMLGVTQGPCTGKLVTELVRGQNQSMNIDLFDPARF